MRENFENDITGEASPPGRASALSVRSANLLFLITSLCLTIIPTVLDSLIPGDSPVLTYIIMFLTAFLLCRKEKVSFPRAFRFRKVQPRTLLLAAVITIALQPFASLIANLTNLVFPDLLEMAEDSLYGGSFLMNMVTVALIPGVCEEFLLRGNVFNAYRSTGRIRAAVLLSALLFGLLHQNATQLFYAFAIGLVLALLFLASDSIWPGILVHFLNNGLSVVENLVEQKHGSALADRIFVFSEMDFGSAGNCVFYGLAFLAGIAVIGLCLRVISRDEGTEPELEQCLKGGGGSARLWTPALVIAVIFLLLVTIAVTGALVYSDELGITF